MTVRCLSFSLAGYWGIQKYGVVCMYLDLSRECISLLEEFQDLVLEVTGKLYDFPALILALAQSVDFEQTEIALRDRNV